VTPATADSFAGEDKQRKTWKPAALIISGALVLAIGIGLVAWRPWAKQEQGNGSTKTNQQAGSIATNNPIAPPRMAYVPGGELMMGRDEKDGGDEYERPAHRVAVKPFFIDLDEVTRQQYQEFVNKTGHAAPANWKGKTFPADTGQQPVTDVSWDDANAYARWAGKRLPSEEEWEFAARGTDGRRYPWGNDWQRDNANADDASKALADVGSYKGASPYGVTDMVGNAWEWTTNKLTAYPGGQLSKQMSGDVRVIRGGSYTESKDEATTTFRRGYPARGNYDYNNTGFRCAKDVTSQ
jgi:serine/threonine-protein kinase